MSPVKDPDERHSALIAENAKLVSENAKLVAANQELVAVHNQLSPEPALDAVQSRIMAKLDPENGKPLQEIASQCGLSEKQCLAHLLSIKNRNFVDSSDYPDNQGWNLGTTRTKISVYESHWIIRPAGLEYMNKHGLLT